MDILCESQWCPVFTAPSTSGSAHMRDMLPYVLASMGFQNIKTPGSSAETAGQNMGL